MMHRTTWLVVAIALARAPGAVAQDGTGGQPTGAPTVQTADTAALRDAKRSATIRFGVEGEVIELLKALAAEKERKHDAEILGLFGNSRSWKLRAAILDFFRILGADVAEQPALDVMDGRDLENAGLVSTALSYLAEIRSKPALAYAKGIVEENDPKLLPAIVRLMGRAGGKDEEEMLLAWVEGDPPSAALGLEAMRALGEMGSERAARALAEIVADDAAAMPERVYAAESLGKIGEELAVPGLVRAANGEDPNVRAAAVAALGSFRGKDAESAIVEALRDPFVKARSAACAAAGRLRLEGAVPILAYKAENDPERSVSVAAFRALGEIGSADAFAALHSRFGDAKAELAARALAFGILARKDPDSTAALGAALLREQAATNRNLYTAIARDLTQGGEAVGIGPLARILLADRDYLIRIGAVDWISRTRTGSLVPEIEAAAGNDANEAVRKRAAEALASLRSGTD